jgi:hypothetical protein
MGKQVLISGVGVVVGIVLGMAFMMCLHMASTLVYPLPDGVDFMSQDPENLSRLNEWFGTLPATAWLLATACHGLGCMSGAVVAILISGRRSLVTPLIVGVVFTLCGIMNLSSVPHPTWFPFVDVPAYLVFALGAGRLLKRKPDPEVSETQADPETAR